MNNKKVWFITGASKGLGLSLVKQLLEGGHAVAGTSRHADELAEAVADTTGQFLALETDLANEASVGAAVQKAVDTFQRIDVVINNAGYGIGGSIEELTDKETRDNFDINVFGTLNVIRAALPYLRAQRSGHIINISSIAGFTASTGWGIYAATKYAIVGLTEVLAADVEALGIKATVVAPGAFRTNFLAPDSLVMTKNPITDYEQIRAAHQKFLKMDGAQAGDPDKAAAAMIKIATEPNPPLYLLLGNDAYERAFQKIDKLDKAFKTWEALTKSTDIAG
jgi:NAD(P)-dependent dehydrogenase (short-subunit alcohol dehydrogenase family)